MYAEPRAIQAMLNSGMRNSRFEVHPFVICYLSGPHGYAKRCGRVFVISFEA